MRSREERRQPNIPKGSCQQGVAVKPQGRRTHRELLKQIRTEHDE
jgi:hypothetical protein